MLCEEKFDSQEQLEEHIIDIDSQRNDAHKMVLSYCESIDNWQDEIEICKNEINNLNDLDYTDFYSVSEDEYLEELAFFRSRLESYEEKLSINEEYRDTAMNDVHHLSELLEELIAKLD